MKALVTGASSGIGRDMARYLASLGYTVYAVGRDERKLSDLKNELGEKIQVIIKDLSVKENSISLYEELKIKYNYNADFEYNFLPSLDFLFLLGKISYSSSTDCLELIVWN